MVGASRPGRVLLILTGLVTCCLGVVLALWFGLLPYLGSGQPTLPPIGTSEQPASEQLAPLLTEREPVYLGTDLEQVPEVNLEPTPAIALARDRTHSTEQWLTLKSRSRSRAVALNDKEEDGFIKELLRTRPDLFGLPFLLGKACRTPRGRAAAFKILAGKAQQGEEVAFLSTETPSLDEDKRRHYRQAHVALLAQILPTEKIFANWVSQSEALDSSGQPEATYELARIAVFSPDKTTRSFALDALAKRAPCAITDDVLVAGLRYPWPPVAENAARAIVKLKRADLIPLLEAILDEADPRGPKLESDSQGQVTVAREVVRINHHRNCLLCHAPAVKGKTPNEALTAEIPLPSESLPSLGGYGGRRDPPQHGLLVRIDMTYLRQDFSAVQPVYDSSAWQVMQRFDFVVRKRVLMPDEARDLRERLKGPSPYHAAAAQALRQLKRS